MFSTILSLFGVFKGLIKRVIEKTPTAVLALIVGVIAGYFFYYLGVQVGESNIRTQLAFESYQKKYEIQQEKTQTTEKVSRLSQALSQSYTNINDTKEKEHEENHRTAHDLKLKYTADRVQQYATTTTTSGGGTTSLSAPTKTIVVSVPQIWGFSPEDRQFLIDEAARADRVDQQLKACKATVDEIYKNHERYQQEMKAYGDRLNQINQANQK